MQDTEDETNSLEEETPVLVPTRSGRVGRPLERLQDFHCWNIDESICSTQTKDREESSTKIVSPAVRETTASLDHSKLFLPLAVLIKKKLRKNRSFVWSPAAEEVLYNIQQSSGIALKTMLMDILDSEMAIGLSEE